MAMVNNMMELIGNTPLLKANRIMENEGLQATLLLKLECFNPLSSAKDRAAYFMLQDGLEHGKITKNTVLIEPTSGNTGVGLAYLCSILGLHLILTMPESMSQERKNLLKALGAELVLTPAAEGMNGSVTKAEELRKSMKNAIILGQFDNPANEKAHYMTTGPEIWRDTDGKVDIFVAGVGTGGTVTGVGRALKEHNPKVQIVAVEPEESPLLSKGVAGPHGIQGIGANFVPSLLDRSVIDRVVTVSTQDARNAAKQLARTEGAFCGISSGAALSAAIAICKELQNKGKTVVALLPDTGERYLSTGVFDD